VAEQHFVDSVESARRQSALSWELRSAMSLSRLWSAQHRIDRARDLLTSVYGRFTEGFATTDVAGARRMLESFR
jgi:predicted ATPase